MFIFCIENGKTIDSIPNNSKHSLNSFRLNFFMNGIFPKYLNCVSLPKVLLPIFTLCFGLQSNLET